MPINASHEFLKAEKEYLNAQTLEDKTLCLEEMIRAAPKHKGSENLLKELRTRLKKLREKSEKAKKSGGGKKGIRKEGFQCALIGLPNSGKSSILAKLTNAKPRIAEHSFATLFPEIGTLDYDGVKAQIVDLPSIGSENFDRGIANTADCLIFVVESLSDLERIKEYTKKARGREIIAINKTESLSENEKRKLSATIRSRKLPALLISAKTSEGINELKHKIFLLMKVIRIYTKEPGKPPSKLPFVLPENSSVCDVAEGIRHGFSSTIKETRLTGPSSKFPNQKVGLSHILKDKDIIEFHTK